MYVKNFVAGHPLAAAENFSWVADGDVALGKSPKQFLVSIYPDHLDTLDRALSNQFLHSLNGKKIEAIFNSPEAFDRVSREDLANAYIRAIQTPQAAGYAAAVSLAVLAHKQWKKSGSNAERDASEMPQFVSISYGGFRSGFGMPSQEFRTGRFEKNPLTEDEIKAIPYLAGAMKQVFDLARQDHSKHAGSVIKKLQDAGFEATATEMARQNGMRHLIEVHAKPDRKNSLSEGPGADALSRSKGAPRRAFCWTRF